MMKYTKKQIIESIAHWTNVLENMNESEDTVDYDHGILRCSARDLIYKDSECLGNEVDIQEIYFSTYGRDRMPVLLDKNDSDAIKNLQQKDPDGYRAMAYIYKGRNIEDSKWTNANDNIENEYDFKEYIDPSSEMNTDYPDEYDVDFFKEFPTYEKWKLYKQNNAIKNFKLILSDSGKLQYESAADNIKVDPDGIVYTTIVWRS